MNNQEVFDKILFGIRKQGQPAISPNDTCMYRTEDGLKCAAGQLIEDSEYQPDFEGLACGGEFVTKNNILVQFLEQKGINYNFTRECQVVHDEAAHEDDFIKLFDVGMLQLAAKHSLKYTV